MNAQQIVQFHRNKAVNVTTPPECVDLTLAAAIEHLVWQAADPDRVRQKAGNALWNALQGSRWPAADSRDVVDSDLGILVLPHQYELVWLRRFESDLRRRMTENGFTSITAKAFTGAVSEIINNVWEHAQAPGPGLLAYQLEVGRVQFGVADLGIGVLNSLRTNPAYRAVTTSMAALKRAMIVGVSRFPDAGRGYGFDTVLRAAADHWGGARLRTGQAILEFHGTSELRKATAAYGVELPGLQVVFTCNMTSTSPVVL